MNSYLADALADAAPTDTIRVIVATRGPSADYTDLARDLGMTVTWTYDIIDAFAGSLPAALVPTLARQPWVEIVELDRPVGKLLLNSINDIQANKAHTAGWDGTGVTIAVIDTGIDQLDSAFTGSIIGCVALVGGAAVPECDDLDGHGTHVASTAAGHPSGRPGVAPGANIVVVRVLHAGGAGLSSDVTAGINWVKFNKNAFTPPIKVATMSIGPLSPGCGNGIGTEPAAADALVAAGVSFTIAAGNSGHNTCTVDSYASAFNVVTVGAADDRSTNNPFDDTLASFSSGGPLTDGRLKPEIVAPGVGITASDIGPLQATLSGTSMATPHVGGAIAVLLEKEPTLTPAQIKTRIITTALAPTAATGLPNNDWGHGLIDVCDMLQLTGCV